MASMEIEMNDNAVAVRERAVQRDARAWSKFSGMKYTRALRLMEHPLTQGILGERICARDVIRVLTEHPVLSVSGKEADSPDRVTHLGDNGLHSAQKHPFAVGAEDDYLGLILTAEVLRMFTRTAQPREDAYSYNLKHTAEEFLGAHLDDFSYVSNGQAIWAAAALGIPIRASSKAEDGLNADFGLVAEQVEYARRMRRRSGSTRDTIRAHHHRPPGYLVLQQALHHYRDTGEAPARWDGVDDQAEPLTSPFHEWLVTQAATSGGHGAKGSRERLAGDYRAGVRDGDHGIAREPEELMMILNRVGADDDFFEMARSAVIDWARTSPLSTGIRTELIDQDRSVHSGWGAGAGDVERYEFRCPCGAGKIVEEHDNIPGFREHDVWMRCAACSDEWEFVPGHSVTRWRIQPVATLSAA